MQQYKFRGKRIDNSQWVVGSLLQSEIATNGYCKCAIVERFADSYNIGQYDVRPETVGMGTTFFDKQGNEIYADDIVKDEIEHIVKFGEYEQDGFIHTGFYLEAVASGLKGCFEKDDAQYLTIVSNIHEQNDARSIQGTHHMLHDPKEQQAEQEAAGAAAEAQNEAAQEALPDSEEGQSQG